MSAILLRVDRAELNASTELRASNACRKTDERFVGKREICQADLPQQFRALGDDMGKFFRVRAGGIRLHSSCIQQGLQKKHRRSFL